MKPTTPHSKLAKKRAVLALLAALPSIAPLSAALYTWDPANASNGATIDVGSGTWNTAVDNLVWNDGAANQPWAQTSSTVALHQAQFAGADAPVGTTYTVNVGASLAVSTTLRFANSGYLLTADAGTSNIITTPQVATNNGKTATISGPLTVRGSGSGTSTPLSLGGYGTLIVKDGATLTSAANNFSMVNGSKLILQSGGTATTTLAVVLGTLTSDATQTQLTVDGGTLSSTATSTTNAIILANAGSGTANTVVTLTNGSILNASTNGGLRFGPGSGTGVATVSGTFNLDGGTLTVARIYEGSGTANNTTSVFNFNGGKLQALSNTANGSTFLNSLNTANVKAGGAVIDTNGASITIGQALLADATSTGGGLTKLGNGTLTLTGANTYTGTTLVSAGTLAFASPYTGLNTSSGVTVSPAARLQVTTGTSASSVAGLTLQAGSVFELNLGTYSASSVSSVAVGTLNADGNYTVELNGSNIPTGTYTVFTYGAKTGSGVPTLGALPPGVTATISDTGTAIVLTVLTPQLTNYVWSAGTGNWDTTTANWTGATYVEGTLATFPNLAGDNVVTLSGARSPFSINLQNNSGNTYTFTGDAIAGTGSLSKTGTGLVTLSAANTYSGATSIAAGALVVTTDGALGSTAGNTTISSGAALALSGGVTYASAEPVSGNGPGTLAALGSLTASQRGLIQSVSGHSTFAGPVSLSANGVTRFGVQNGASLTLSGTIAPAAGVTNAGVLFRAGETDGDFITVSGVGNTWHQTTAIYTGLATGAAGVRLGVDNGLPTGVSVIASGNFSGAANTLDLNGFNQTMPGLVPSDGNLQITNRKSGSSSMLTLDTSTADVTNAPDTVGTNLTVLANGAGTLSLLKKGAFKQSLEGVHTYTGTTTIESGTLAFTGTGSAAASPFVIHGGAALDVSGITATSFDLAAGLSGSGSVLATGKTVTISGAFAPGLLAVTGDLTLAAGATTSLVVSASPATTSTLTVSGALVLGGTLAISREASFTFAAGQTFDVANGTITTGLSAVTVNGVSLTESSPDVWTGTGGGLNYTFTETTAVLSVTSAITPLQAWRNTYFPTAGNDGTGIGANDADPDADGLSNLIEYATNTSPVAANASRISVGVASGSATLTFTRIDDPSLRYTVEATGNLPGGIWTPVTAANNPSFGFAGSVAGVTETASETVQDSVAAAPGAPRFLRLVVDVIAVP